MSEHAQEATPTPAPADPTTNQPTPQEPTAPPAEAPTGSATDDEGTETEWTAEGARKVRNEARNLRTRLRDTEAERDTLTATVDTLRTQLVDGLLEPMGVTPAAFWAAGSTLGDLLDDAGGIDPQKVATAAQEATAKLGLIRPPRPNPAQGGSASGAPASDDGPSWGDVFKRGGKR